MTMKNQSTGKLEIGKEIYLERGEKLLIFKNKFNGEIVYSTTKYELVNREGRDFLPVFKKPNSPKERRVNLIAMDAVDRVRI